MLDLELTDVIEKEAEGSTTGSLKRVRTVEEGKTRRDIPPTGLKALPIPSLPKTVGVRPNLGKNGRNH